MGSIETGQRQKGLSYKPMSWIDKKSIEQVLKLRDKFHISTYIETGTFKGINAKFHAQNFKEVLTCDIGEEYLKKAREKLKSYKNVFIYKQPSPDFLKSFVERYNREGRKDIVLLYLDAHFYDPALPPEEKWVVKRELKALAGFKNCVIYIHDFDCQGLGHCSYGGEHLDLELVKDDLLRVNPNFHLYTNSRELCDIYDEKTIADVPGITLDEDTLDNMRFAHSAERSTYRGILYASPAELDLNYFELKKAKMNI